MVSMKVKTTSKAGPLATRRAAWLSPAAAGALPVPAGATGVPLPAFAHNLEVSRTFFTLPFRPAPPGKPRNLL